MLAITIRIGSIITAMMMIMMMMMTSFYYPYWRYYHRADGEKVCHYLNSCNSNRIYIKETIIITHIGFHKEQTKLVFLLILTGIIDIKMVILIIKQYV